MSDEQLPAPTEIKLHTRSRCLEIAFEDGSRFELPYEYLRVFSPSAENRVARQRGEWATGKQDVDVSQISPVGSYAIQLHFDDGHDTGIFSWETLYKLGREQEANWVEYQRQTADKPRLALDNSAPSD